VIILLKNILKNQKYISRKTGIKLCVSVCLSEEILTTFFTFSQAVATMEVAAVATRMPAGATTSVRCQVTVAAVAAASSSSETVAGAGAAAPTATTTTGKKTRLRLSTRSVASSARV